MDILTDFSPSALIRAVEGSRAVWMSLGAGWPLVEIHDDPDVLWRTCNAPNPAFNGGMRACFDADTADARLDELLAVYDSIGTPVIWWLNPSATPADLGARLEAHGFEADAPAPGMALDLHAPPIEVLAVPGLSIRPVEGAADRLAYGEVLADSYGAPLEFARLYADFLNHLTDAEAESLRWLVGALDGEIVGTAAVLYSDGVAGVYNISTLRRAQRRGIGAVLTAAALDVARAEGYRIAVLQSSEMGLNIYRRLGFYEVCAFGWYWRDGRE